MITVTILPAIFILLHTIFLVRFCIDLFFGSESMHYSFSWFLFIFLVPVIGYFNYYRRFMMNARTQDSGRTWQS